MLAKKRIILAGLFFVAIGAVAVHADIIHMRGGAAVEGKVGKKTREKVYIDVEAGTLAVNKDEIDWIEEKDGDEKELANQKLLPAFYVEELYTKSRTIIQRRRLVFKVMRNCATASRKIHRHEKAYLYHDAKIGELTASIELAQAEEKKQLRDQLMIDRNTHIIKKRVIIEETREMFLKRLEFEHIMTDKLEDLFEAQYEFNEDFLNVNETQIEPQDAFYFRELEKDAQTFLHDFALGSISYTDNNGRVFVNAVLNRDIPVLFLVDLQSPVVVISEKVAQNLDLARVVPVGDIDLSEYNSTVEFGEPTILRSIQIDDVVSEYVTTCITSTLPYDHIDGVLGLSFFYSSIIRPDQDDKQILLYKFLPTKE
jgi:hypothetical protein